jgi:hypothetical protein
LWTYHRSEVNTWWVLLLGISFLCHCGHFSSVIASPDLSGRGNLVAEG